MVDDGAPGLRTTRRSLHAVAEHVLAPALHRATGRIGLRASPGGFTTPPFPRGDGDLRVAVDGADLVVDGDHDARRRRLTTLGDAAAFVGIDPGAPADVYPPTTPLEPDTLLAVDPDAADRLARFFATVDQALVRLCRELAAEDPAEIQLWPEHFDLATTSAEVNYGGSPGDDDHPGPYLYVGPWGGPPDGDPFWNETFGSSEPASDDLTSDQALAYFLDGHRRLRP